jgi:peptidoglycan/LPS O-acetylase OafA/YrhL
MTRIRGFDGIRTLALLLVFLQHYARIGQILEMGGYGVWLFFVLSGFLIVRILHGERQRIEAGEVKPAAAIGRFYWRRTLRIMPIYYLALVVMTVLGALGLVKGVTWPATAWHYVYASNFYFGHIADGWVGPMAHFWSLAIEEQFYLLAAPALLLFIPAGKARWACAAMILVAVGTSLLLRTSGASEFLLYNSSLINFGALAAGGLMGLSLRPSPGAGRNGWFGAGLILAYLGLIVGMWAFPKFPADIALLIAGAPLIVASLLAALLLRTVFLNQDSWLVKALELWPIRQLGRISYGFYLYHKLLPSWMVYWTLKDLGIATEANYWVEFVAAFLVSLALASASWVLIEKPLMRWKDRPPLWPARLWQSIAKPATA